MSSSHKRKSESRKQTKKVAIILVIVAIVIAAAVVVIVLVSGKNDKKQPSQAQSTDQVTKQTEETKKKSEATTFALFGVDTRDTSAAIGDQNRSDAIMIVSIDPDANTIKLISVLRDSKVPIKGYDPQKINAAYKYGGVNLALDTLNDNFDLNLRNYISVDFGKMQKLIDLIGGVDVEITQDEADIINSSNPDAEPVYEGVAHLNGAQALSYARIRSLDGDDVRASRQQNVLNAVLHRMREMGSQSTLDMLQAFMDSMDTSYYYDQLYDILSSVDLNTATLSRYEVPDIAYETDVVGGLDETGSWVWQYDLDAAGKRINRIINGEE